MKLLAELQKQVGRMGNLRRAWFTSFSANIEFVETYILSAALGVEPPRSRLEYEHLQQGLLEKDIDFRIFCDPRAFDASRLKRTCIPVHHIRPAHAQERFSQASLFHPKIVYLEDHDGKRIIGAGSANLTLSGWARNLEAFQFFDITSYENYRDIRQFFENLCAASGIECGLTAKPKFSEKPARWRFVHSYQKASFARQFLADQRNKDLVVWSPYLPRDLAGFIGGMQQHAGAQGLRVHLVPDRIEGRYLRTQWSAGLTQMVDEDQLTFHECPAPRDPATPLCHAKIWKLPGKLAIGSWNFTGPGANSLCDADGRRSLDNNVEAGFIITDNHAWEDAHGPRLTLGADDCATPALLDAESLDLPSLPPFDLQVTFDWRAQAYAFACQWLGSGPREGYSLRLPGIAAALPLSWNRLGNLTVTDLPQVDDTALLRDRLFRIFFSGNEIHRGVIHELNPDSRRAQSFETLQDLLEALIHGDDPRSLTDLPFRIPLDTDSFPGDQPVPVADALLAPEVTAQGGLSYFRLFSAMRRYQAKLEAIQTLEQLDQQVLFWPGCLLELVDKTRQALTEPGREIFNWFLAHEVRALCVFAIYQRRAFVHGPAFRKRKYEWAPEASWHALNFVLPPAPAGIAPEYYQYVMEKSDYV